jgi:hypothetical protein
VIALAGFDFEAKLTLDGIMTLAAGAIAYVAAVRQIRHADQGLKQQLQAEKDARSQEGGERKRALATAMLFEIDDIYAHYLKPLWESTKDLDPENCSLETLGVVKPFPANPFPVFAGNASGLGELKSETVASVVRFYDAASSLLQSLVDYREHHFVLYSPMAAKVPDVHEKAIRMRVGEVKSIVPELKQLAYKASEQLCNIAALPFSEATVAVAAEKKTE